MLTVAGVGRGVAPRGGSEEIVELKTEKGDGCTITMDGVEGWSFLGREKF